MGAPLALRAFPPGGSNSRLGRPGALIESEEIMTYEVNGKVLEATDDGFLTSPDDWDMTSRRRSRPRRG